MAKKFDFDKKNAKLKIMQQRIPALIGTIALKHFEQSFRNQGFTDSTLDPWVARKSKNKSDRNNPRRRAILVDSVALSNSGKVQSANWERIVVGFYGVEYGKYHNRGEGHNPKRQFIGPSKVLTKRVSDLLNNEIKKIISK